MRAPILGFLLVLFSFPVLAQYPVSLTLTPPSRQTADLQSTWTVTVTNRTNAPIETVHLYLSANPSTVIDAPREICTLVNGASCDFPLGANAVREVVFVTRNGSPFGHYGVVAEAPGQSAVTYDEAVFGPEFPVTMTADSGAGSLRQAILDVSRECTSGPCVVRFAIDSAPHVIALHSPLPEITAPDVFVDGGSQPIVLDGRAAGPGNGLLFHGNARVSNLTVSGFEGNGIEVRGGFAMIIRNRLTDNALRGVMFVDAFGYVAENILSGNRRAGGFFWTSQNVRALRNTVTNNGASGLFFHKPASSFRFSEAIENTIEGNGEAGIALSLAATGDYARNSFRNNGGLAIDVGLDGPTTATVMGIPGEGAVIGAPVITSARFENGVTTVTGRIAPPANSVSSFQRVSIYSTQGVVATEEVRGSEFTIHIGRDLQGQEVRAAMYTNVIYNFDNAATATSELGEARVVE